MIGLTSIHTQPSDSGDVWRDLHLGRNVNRNLSRERLELALDGVVGGVGPGVIGPGMKRENRLRRASPMTEALDENTLVDGYGQDGDGEDGDKGVHGFGGIFLGVHGMELVPVGVASPSQGRRLRSRPRRRGRRGHEPVGETHSFGRVHSGTEASRVCVLWRALSVTST